MIQPQSRKLQELPATGRGGRTFPWSLQRGHTQISDLWPPALRENTLLWFEAPSLWFSLWLIPDTDTASGGAAPILFYVNRP